MKNILILKDINYKSVEKIIESNFKLQKDDIEVIAFSEFYTSKFSKIKSIRNHNADTLIFVFIKKYIKWSLIFYLFLFLTKSKKNILSTQIVLFIMFHISI